MEMGVLGTTALGDWAAALRNSGLITGDKTQGQGQNGWQNSAHVCVLLFR